MRDKIIALEEIKKLLVAIQNPSSKDEAKMSIDALEVFKISQKQSVHVLKIFEANTRAMIGEHELARMLMMDALDVNPYITSAWKDLGDMYFRGYDLYEAWVCWNIARKIDSNHPILESVYNFEHKLQIDYPELF